MNKIKRIVVLGTLMLGVFWGCDNSLSPSVYSSVSEQKYEFSEDDFDGAIGTIYSSMRSWWHHQHYYMAQEVSADGIVMPANPSGWEDGGIYRNLHLHSWNSEIVNFTNMWNDFYKGIFLANRAYNQVEGDHIPVPSEVDKDAALAEIRVARAFLYWLLMDNFGDVPLVVSNTQELPGKKSREEVYEFIHDELTESIPLLSEENNTMMYGRFNKWAAKALLANVYLNAEVYTGQAEWEEAIKQADDIINSGKYSLENNYRDIFKTENSGSPEIIFALPFDEELASGFYIQKVSWHSALVDKYDLQHIPWGPGSAKGITQFINTYDSSDTRLNDTWLSGPQNDSEGNPLTGSFDQAGEPLVFTKELPNGTFTGEAEGYRMNKFEVKEGARDHLSNDFPFFRYAGILSIKAEALLRTGNADEAASLLTEVRQRAFHDDPQKAVVTENDLQNDSRYEYGYVEDYEIIDNGDETPISYGAFLDELGWEFAWEGRRRRDMIRFGAYTTKSWLSHRPNGDYRKVFPIPQQAINSNPNLIQNPDY